MKLILFITLLTSALPAQALENRIDSTQCAALKAAARNQIETIYLAEMAHFHEKAAQESVRPSGKEVDRSLYEEALSHYDRKTSMRGAEVLSDLCPMQ